MADSRYGHKDDHIVAVRARLLGPAKVVAGQFPDRPLKNYCPDQFGTSAASLYPLVQICSWAPTWPRLGAEDGLLAGAVRPDRQLASAQMWRRQPRRADYQALRYPARQPARPPAASLAPADDHAARAPDARLTHARQAIRIAFVCECAGFRWRCRHQHL